MEIERKEYPRSRLEFKTCTLDSKGRTLDNRGRTLDSRGRMLANTGRIHENLLDCPVRCVRIASPEFTKFYITDDVGAFIY